MSEDGFLRWRKNQWDLLLRLKGPEGETTYNYDLEFSADELARLVEVALTSASKDAALAKAIGVFIRKVLNKKNQDPRYR